HHPSPTRLPYTTLFRSCCPLAHDEHRCAVFNGGFCCRVLVSFGRTSHNQLRAAGVILPGICWEEVLRGVFAGSVGIGKRRGRIKDRKSTRLNSSHVSIS